MLFPDAEFADLDQLRKHRQACWEHQREYVRRRSALFNTHWQGSTLPRKLEDLPQLPLIDKQTLRESQLAQPPFGNYLAARPDEIVRIHRTSGTTGTAMNLALSARDAHETAEVGARCQRASGLGPGHRVAHCLNYRLWMGGFTDHTTLEAAGAAVIPFGVGDSALLIRTIQELGITALSCTPSYPAVLEQVMARQFAHLTPRDLGLQLGLFGGEPGLDDPAFRHRLERNWGFSVRNANYGVTDVLCNFAGQTECDPDLHFMALDVLHPELIDPDTLQVKAWQGGETGELVLTHVDRQCQPLVRFRTGDIVTLTDTGKARCGRTAPRFRVVGRSDDMVVVRGINAFPSQVAAVINGFESLSGEYRIRVRGPGPYDVLPIEVELAAGRVAPAGLAQAVADAIKTALGMRARITLLDFAALPRSEGKIRRLWREPLEPQA